MSSLLLIILYHKHQIAFLGQDHFNIFPQRPAKFRFCLEYILVTGLQREEYTYQLG